MYVDNGSPVLLGLFNFRLGALRHMMDRMDINFMDFAKAEKT